MIPATAPGAGSAILRVIAAAAVIAATALVLPSLKIRGRGRQPSGPPSICKGVDSPTETLTTALEARQHVSALYQAHALALVKLAVLMTGDQPTAEDVVQDAFLGLYRRWQALHDADKALGYLRSSVLNGCRSVHRVRFRRQGITLDPPGPVGSAEAEACSARRTAR